MNRDTILNMASTLNCEYEIGIWCETNDFLKQQKNVMDFNLKYYDGRFNLVIKLREYNLQKVKSLFHSLVMFLEYSATTFYCREENKDHIEFYLLSTMPSEKAFLFNIKFYETNDL